MDDAMSLEFIMACSCLNYFLTKTLCTEFFATTGHYKVLFSLPK